MDKIWIYFLGNENRNVILAEPHIPLMWWCVTSCMCRTQRHLCPQELWRYICLLSLALFAGFVLILSALNNLPVVWIISAAVLISNTKWFFMKWNTKSSLAEQATWMHSICISFLSCGYWPHIFPPRPSGFQYKWCSRGIFWLATY